MEPSRGRASTAMGSCETSDMSNANLPTTLQYDSRRSFGRPARPPRRAREVKNEASALGLSAKLRRLLTPLSAPKSWARLSRACVWCARGPFPHPRADDFEMKLPQNLDDLEQHALSIQGVCKHRDDQVCMSGRLRVHGCVHLIHMIARCNRHAWF